MKQKIKKKQQVHRGFYLQFLNLQIRTHLLREFNGTIKKYRKLDDQKYGEM